MSNALRNVYSAAEFAAEILCGKRSREWVQDQCRFGRIRTVARKPYLIPASEAMRFMGPPPDERRVRK